MQPAADIQEESSNPLHHLLGGWRGGLESAAPSIVLAVSYVASGSNLNIALIAALAVAAVLALLRIARREKPVRVVGGLLAVGIAALVAARTGSAVDYFLPSLLANVVSALAWALSILIGWPLLGVILGFAFKQRATWRDDADLVHAYSVASWVWTISFVVRAAVQLPLWLTDNVVGLAIARLVLGWPMVLGVIAMSWWLIRRTLPPDHPGVLHPWSHQDGRQRDNSQHDDQHVAESADALPPALTSGPSERTPDSSQDQLPGK